MKCDWVNSWSCASDQDGKRLSDHLASSISSSRQAPHIASCRGIAVSALVCLVALLGAELNFEGFATATMGGGVTADAHPEGTILVRGHNDCLLPLTFVDQFDRRVSLASLHGQLVLMNFVSEPCTQSCRETLKKLVFVAQKLRKALGKNITMVTIVPDRQSEAEDALVPQPLQRSGWLFLLGTRSQLDELRAPFVLGLKQASASRSALDHLMALRSQELVYLIGPHGREMRIYDMTVVRPESLAFDLYRLLPYGEEDDP